MSNVSFLLILSGRRVHHRQRPLNYRFFSADAFHYTHIITMGGFFFSRAVSAASYDYSPRRFRFLLMRYHRASRIKSVPSIAADADDDDAISMREGVAAAIFLYTVATLYSAPYGFAFRIKLR